MAERFAQTHYPDPSSVWNRNAARHAAWQISLHFQYGQEVARNVGLAHEAAADPNDRDHRADVINNEIALEMAERFEAMFENLGMTDRVDQQRWITREILEGVNSGLFVVDENDRRINEDWNR